MDRPIQFHSLLKDELAYEVSIRSVTPANTVKQLKEQLRNLLVECPSEAICETDIPASSELKIISEKLELLKGLVDTFTQVPEDRYAATRALALGNHIYHRLLRVNAYDPADLLVKKDLRSCFDELMKMVDDRFSASELKTQSSSVEVSAHQTSAAPTFTCRGDSNILKWKVKFNGLSDPRSFLESVEEYQISFGVSDEKLFLSASLLFVDQGLLWYRGIKSQVSSWLELKTLLLEEFDPVDYDYRLMGEIRARTQGADEPVHIYFSVMFRLFSRLRNPLKDEAMLEILLHNIRPTFSQQLALTHISSVADLKAKCRTLESARQRAEFFVEPPKSGPNILNQDLCYKSKQKPVVSSVYNSEKPNKSDQPIKNNHNKFNSQKPKLICRKCGKSDHDFRKCQGNKSYHCYKCGEKDFTVRNCPKCNKETLPSSKN